MWIILLVINCHRPLKSTAFSKFFLVIFTETEVRVCHSTFLDVNKKFKLNIFFNYK